MAYTKTDWKARQGANLNKFTKSGETATTVILENTPDVITVPGTPFSPENMNHIEEGIFQAHIDIAAEVQARQQADTTLQNSITAEAQARQQADTALQNSIAAEARVCQQNFADLLSQISDLVRLIETNLGPIPRFFWIADDGSNIVTDDGDYIALA